MANLEEGALLKNGVEMMSSAMRAHLRRGEGSEGGGHHDRSTLTRGVGLVLRHQARSLPGEVVRADQVDLNDAPVGIQICR